MTRSPKKTDISGFSGNRILIYIKMRGGRSAVKEVLWDFFDKLKKHTGCTPVCFCLSYAVLCNQLSDVEAQIRRRDREKQTVGAIEHAAVSGDEIGKILYADHTFDQRLGKISDLSH